MQQDNAMSPGSIQPHSISVVIPVYNGASTLDALMVEIAPLVLGAATPDGYRFEIAEVVLIFDHGPDESAVTIRRLAAQHDFVRPIWLSRNFGQHSATLAGMASSGSEWIATLDEDGQHNPSDIGRLLDSALLNAADLVYAKPTNKPPHGILRNAASRLSKRMVALLASDNQTVDYQSFRLMVGEIGRSVAAYAGHGVYLDVALGWIAAKVSTADVALRGDTDRPSGYSTRKLLSHFWRLVLTSGTKPLRMVSLFGALIALAGFSLGAYFVIERLAGGDLPLGYTSTISLVLFLSGAILIALGVIAEYVGIAVNMAMGKPLYLIVSDPAHGPMGRRRTGG